MALGAEREGVFKGWNAVSELVRTLALPAEREQTKDMHVSQLAVIVIKRLEDVCRQYYRDFLGLIAQARELTLSEK